MNPTDDPLHWQPWFVEALVHARIGAGSRVLQLTAQDVAQSRALLGRVGDDGTLTAVEPDRYRAAAINELDHPGLAVLGYEPDGDETFGTHDAVIACPLVLADWPLDRWGRLIVGNLRPGGRFVIDMPGERHCETLRELWQEIQAPADLLRGWTGPAPRALARLLQADGLRNVDATVTTHLVRMPGAAAAADWFGDLLAVPDDLRASLRLALTRHAATPAELELLFRRTRVTGMR